MGNTISDYFTDTELVNNLRMFFDSDEMWNIDFRSVLNLIEDYGDDFFVLKFKNRVFHVDKIVGDVEEIK